MTKEEKGDNFCHIPLCGSDERGRERWGREGERESGGRENERVPLFRDGRDRWLLKGTSKGVCRLE